MVGTRVSIVGRHDRALPDGCKAERGRHGKAGPTITSAAALLLLLGLPIATRAQVPGPESFAQEPKTPKELWSAIDYLIRTGQAKKAVPYLDKFLKSQAGDQSFVEIRDRYGLGSVMRLGDDPATARYAELIAGKLIEATRRYATQPDRLRRFVTALTGSPEEQSYAISHLREAGPIAVPYVIEALNRPGIRPEDRARLVQNLGLLDHTAVPPLLALLESGNPRLMADAATALGPIGDPRVIPFLTYPAASAASPPELRAAAQTAISRLTGKPYEASSRSPIHVLADAAWQFHRHQVEFPGDPVAVWVWNKEQNAPVSQSMRRADAESYFGLMLADQAIKLDPRHLEAQAVDLSLSLQKAIDRVGFSAFPAQDQGAYAAARKAGPAVLTEVLHKALSDGKDELGAVAASALGEVTQPAELAHRGRPHPLVDALVSPGARTQFAAARALVSMAPTLPFPGSSRVVPALARFVTAQSPPRAVVIDSNPARGSQLVGSLRGLGYETVLESRGDQGFLAAADTTDIELVLVSYALHGERTWSLTDILTNLKSDARTADLPVFVYGPLSLELNRPNLPLDFPGVRFLVQPMTPEILEKLIGGRPSRFSGGDRAGYAQQATALLAQIAQQPHSPFEHDLKAAEPALMTALSQPATSMAASTALGDVPDSRAQRSLADVVLDPSRPVDLRRNSASQLVRSVKQYGPLVSADQETRLAMVSHSESDPPLRTVLESAVTALRSWSQKHRTLPQGARVPGAATTVPVPAPASAVAQPTR